MGLYDFFSDLYAAVSVQDAHAEAPSGDMNDSRNQGTGKSTTAQQSGEASLRGGASTKTPASGTDEQSSEEAEVNAADAGRQRERDGGEEPPAQGHKPGTGGEASGQRGGFDREKARQAEPEDDEEKGEDEEPEETAEAEEEEEEEEEPEDPKVKLEAGKMVLIARPPPHASTNLLVECANSKQCISYKDHYDHCVERVTSQIDNEGKAKEDCVEECEWASILLMFKWMELTLSC